MKEEINSWKEYTEDQNKRSEAMIKDPGFPFIYGGYGSTYLYEWHYRIMKAKYGIEDRNYTNFMDWLAKGKLKFAGIEVSVKEDIQP